MKLPRWLVIAMLTTSVLAVLAAAGWFGWWWVTWPERTAREFIALINAKRVEDANALMEFAPLANMNRAFSLRKLDSWRNAALDCRSRTLSEVLAGVQEFSPEKLAFSFIVRRGTVIPKDGKVIVLVEDEGGVVVGPDKIRIVDPFSDEDVLTIPGGSINFNDLIRDWSRVLRGG